MEFNDLDKRVLAAMDGRDRLRLLLKERGLSIQDFAQKRNLWVEQVSMCLKGTRTYHEVRDALSDELDVDRIEIDRMIDGPKTAVAS